MKIVFMEDDLNLAKEHESYGNDLENIFRIAEKITEADLNKFAVICKQFDFDLESKKVESENDE